MASGFESFKEERLDELRKEYPYEEDAILVEMLFADFTHLSGEERKKYQRRGNEISTVQPITCFEDFSKSDWKSVSLKAVPSKIISGRFVHPVLKIAVRKVRIEGEGEKTFVMFHKDLKENYSKLVTTFDEENDKKKKTKAGKGQVCEGDAVAETETVITEKGNDSENGNAQKRSANGLVQEKKSKLKISGNTNDGDDDDGDNNNDRHDDDDDDDNDDVVELKGDYDGSKDGTEEAQPSHRKEEAFKLNVASSRMQSVAEKSVQNDKIASRVKLAPKTVTLKRKLKQNVSGCVSKVVKRRNAVGTNGAFVGSSIGTRATRLTEEKKQFEKILMVDRTADRDLRYWLIKKGEIGAFSYSKEFVAMHLPMMCIEYYEKKVPL